MGNLHLVTGRAGTPHVTAADHGSLHAGIFGEGEYVLNRGSKFTPTVISNNTIRIADGDIVMQGRHIRLDEGTYIDLTIENGTQGYFRNDLIVVRYIKDVQTGAESADLAVIKGTASAGTAMDPEYTVGDIINDHVSLAEMPLFRVPLNGLNVQTLVPLYEEASFLADGSVVSRKIADRAVGTSKIADNAVTKQKLAPGATYNTATVNLTVSGWASGAQAVNVSGVTANNLVIVAPNPGSYVAYGESGVRCVAQEAGKLIFACDNIPSENLAVNIVMPV